MKAKEVHKLSDEEIDAWQDARRTGGAEFTSAPEGSIARHDAERLTGQASV
jgi:hypothetical protein